MGSTIRFICGGSITLSGFWPVSPHMASLAAPRAAPNSPALGISSGTFKVVARTFSQMSEVLPPPIAVSLCGLAPVRRSASRQSRSAKLTPSITAWVKSFIPVVLAIPAKHALILASLWGVRSPDKYGRNFVWHGPLISVPNSLVTMSYCAQSLSNYELQCPIP